MLALGASACASAGRSAGDGDLAYPFAGLSSVRGTDAAAEARSAYPVVFQVVDDPAQTEEVDARPLRRDLSHVPVDGRSYRALRAIAVAFFELHARAERRRGEGLYFVYSFQATKVIAIPWRLYGEIPDVGLRSVILDFYEDVMFGAKPGLGPVRGRYTRMVADLARKESDAALLARIEELVDRARALTPEPVR